MAFTLSPGIAVSEYDLTTIVPQSSSTTAAFAGFFRWGPINQPVLVDTETTLRNIFQPPGNDTAVFYWSAANFLDYSNSLYVVRANTTGVATATANTLATVMVPNKDNYFSNYYTNGAGGRFGPWLARYPGSLGNNLIISLCPTAEAFSSNVTTNYGITVTANVGSTTATTSADATQYLTVGDLVSIGQDSGVSNGYITLTGISGTTLTLSGAPVSANGSTYALARRWQYSSLFPGAPGTSQYVAGKGGANDQMHIIIVDAAGAFYNSSTPNFVLEKYAYVSKASDAKNNDSTTNYYKDVLYNKSQYIYWADHITTWNVAGVGLGQIILGQTALATPGTSNWGNTAQGTIFTYVPQVSTEKLVGGHGPTTAYNPQSFTGGIGGLTDPNDAGLIQAYSLFQNVDELDISLVITGPASPVVQQYVIDNIVTERLDCVALLSPRYSDVVNNVNFEASTIVNSYLADLARNTSYAVVDSGWKYQYDKYNSTYRYVPLNGDIAGLCAYTDKIRNPWWSPAGFNRGQIKNVVKLAWNPGNSGPNPYRDLLYQNGVNPVVTMKGQGTVLYGDKTLLSQPSAFDRINVRRLFIILEKSIAKAAKYSLFEFNDNFTRTAFINMVTPFLSQIQGGRGITAFKVVCDATNNPPAVVDADQFVGDIYIQPARSINFIQLNFVAVGTGVDFTEIVGTYGGN